MKLAIKEMGRSQIRRQTQQDALPRTNSCQHNALAEQLPAIRTMDAGTSRAAMEQTAFQFKRVTSQTHLRRRILKWQFSTRQELECSMSALEQHASMIAAGCKANLTRSARME